MADIIVIGGGITGVSAALTLTRAGQRVVLIDRVAPGDPAQASYGNAGVLARNAVVPVSVPGLVRKLPAMLSDPDSPLFLRWSYLPRLLPWIIPFLRNGRPERLQTIAAALAQLTGDSVGAHQALARGTAAAGLIETGNYAFLYRNRAEFEGDAAAMGLRRQHGFTWREAEGADLAAIDPALGPAIGFAAVFADHGWIRDPGAYLAALAQAFSAAGGVIRRAEVAAIRPGDRPEVTLQGGEILTCHQIILAAGAWSALLLTGLGAKVPLESERGYHLMLRGANRRPLMPLMVAGAKFVITPMADGLRAAGIVEFGGLEAGPSAGPPALLRRRLTEVYPGLQAKSWTTWLGHRPCLPDSLPVLGPWPGIPGVICAFGGQHVGLTIGPKLGRLAAEAALGLTANDDLPAIAAKRFAAHR